MNEKLISDLLEKQIAYLRGKQIVWLGFPELLEQRFEKDVSGYRSRRLALASLIFVMVYNIFLISDFKSLPDRFGTAVALRLFVFTPLAIGSYLWLKRNPSHMVRGLVVVTLAGVAAACMMFLYRDTGIILTANVQVGLLLLLLLTNVVMRLRFGFATVCTAFCIISSVVFLQANTHLQLADKLHLLMVIASGAGLITMASYTLEREERMGYLLHLNVELKREELAEANRELSTLSTLDGLTRLMNRATFERKIGELWAEAQATCKPLSAVMVDIDHFKVVNDTQGHLYGDEVIKRVATLMQQSLRGKRDIAARYGGEEFVLLLPDTDLEAAIKVAERVRTLVQLAGSPAPTHRVPEPGLWTTVSCGVATVINAMDLDYRRLLLAADTALYTAKAEGRNRVSAAPLLGADASEKTDVTRIEPDDGFGEA